MGEKFFLMKLILISVGQYLLRNRAETNTMPFPHLNGFNNTCSMRLSVLKNIFNTLKDAGE